MSKKIIFLGPLYPNGRELEIKENSITNISNAPNVYQWNLLRGLRENVQNDIHVINVLPVGTWRGSYKKLYLPDQSWQEDGLVGYEIGSVNLPFIKQLQRICKTRRILKKIADENSEIIIYSAYMPFLKAVYRLPKNIKVTAIITDLPEFYDLGKASVIRKFLRAQQNKLIYKYLERIDRFVVLTKQMCIPLKVGERPWLCIEGICDNKPINSKTEKLTGDKHVIFYSGTLHYQYGIKTLLDAFELIEERDVELWICGGGEAANDIKQLSQKDDRIKFYGFCTQAEVAELRERATILVNPRTNDGEYTKYSFPSKTMEYMASGKPVVMYKLDGIPDEYDEYLFYINPTYNQVEGLKKVVENVLNNYEASLVKASQAQKFVIENKNNEVQSKKIIDFIYKNY